MLEASIDEQLAKLSDPITLNIGGTLFDTSKATLLAQRGTFFDALLSDRWKPDASGKYFIDRDPMLFPVILNYLRTGKIYLKRYPYDVIDELKVELDFYQIDIEGIAGPTISQYLSPAHQQQIIEWIGKSSFTPLYIASKDGFGANVFHEKCDNKGPTLTLVRHSYGYHFGGFAAMPWDSSQSYKRATGSFLFTLHNPHSIPPTKYSLSPCCDNSAMYNHSGYGPTFGGGHDIYIVNNFNTNNCSCNFPHSYSDTTGRGTGTFTGSANFTIADIEVFLVN